jgi:hypothetical protein
MTSQLGGALTKVLVTLLVLVVLASVGLFVYARTQDPLVFDEGDVALNQPLEEETPPQGADVVLRGDGEIYVAGVIRNDGRLPITLRGLGDLGDIEQVPYIPVEIRLGDGDNASIDDSSTFTATSISPDAGVGVVIVYAPNPDLICRLFPDTATNVTYELGDFPLRFTTVGIEAEQTLGFDEPLVVAEPTAEECEQVAGTQA